VAQNREVKAGGIAIVATVAWAAAHSIPVALCVFPEFRYTYANMLAVFSGGAAWCAYLGAGREDARFAQKICSLGVRVKVV
jgi:hypothetical protein